MSSEDNLDNSATAALLQPESVDADQNLAPKEEDLVSLTEGEQPVVDQSQGPSDEEDSKPAQVPQDSDVDPKPQPESVPDVIVPVETPQVELKIEDETEPEVKAPEKPLRETPAEDKPAEVPVSSEPAVVNHDVENPKEDAQPEEEEQLEGDKVPIAPAPKDSKTSRLRSRIRSVTAKETRMATSLEDISSLRLWKGVAAEFLGTLLLTMIGCGSCINLNGASDTTSPVVQIALCFGLSVATIVWAIGHVSGGHINPAVTIAMLATRKISLAKAGLYIIFQLIGAIVGAGILYGLTPSGYHGNLGATLVNDNLNAGQAFGVELLITFVLILVIFASVDSRRRDLNGSTPLTIGLAVTMCHLFAVEFTGSSMNTARSFGPAVVIGKWADHWVYWVGPLLGGALAGLLYDNLFAVNASLEKAKACLLSSEYDDDRYQAQKMKIRIIEEDPEDPKGESLSLNQKREHKDTDPSDIPYIDE